VILPRLARTAARLALRGARETRRAKAALIDTGTPAATDAATAFFFPAFLLLTGPL